MLPSQREITFFSCCYKVYDKIFEEKGGIIFKRILEVFEEIVNALQWDIVWNSKRNEWFWKYQIWGYFLA